MEIEVVTSLLTVITFYVRGEIDGIPSIFEFSNELSVTVACGSEQVLVSQPTFVLPILNLDPASSEDLSLASLGLSQLFSSSNSLCPLLSYSLY